MVINIMTGRYQLATPLPALIPMSHKACTREFRTPPSTSESSSLKPSSHIPVGIRKKNCNTSFRESSFDEVEFRSTVLIPHVSNDPLFDAAFVEEKEDGFVLWIF